MSNLAGMLDSGYFAVRPRVDVFVCTSTSREGARYIRTFSGRNASQDVSDFIHAETALGCSVVTERVS